MVQDSRISRRPWTTGEVRKLRALRLEGHSAAEIGDALGRTRHAVQSYLAYLKSRYGEKAIPKLSAYDRREREAA